MILQKMKKISLIIIFGLSNQISIVFMRYLKNISISLKNYFLFKNLIIGQGKYGTVGSQKMLINRILLQSNPAILLIPQNQLILG